MNAVSKDGEKSPILWAIANNQGPNWIYANVKIGQLTGAYEKGWKIRFDAVPNLYSDSKFS
jgi:hypothetical protein